jgi:hypothetical protein
MHVASLPEILETEDGRSTITQNIPDFTNAIWGENVRSWVEYTKRLKPDKHWCRILPEAAERVELP